MPAPKEAPRKPRFLLIHHTDMTQAQQIQAVNESHRRRGYSESSIKNPKTGSGWFIAYHYFVGTDGTVVQTRPDDDRTETTSCGMGLKKCVRDPEVNENAIAIVLAGDFTWEQPTQAQLVSLRKLVAELDAKYHFEKIEGHRDASPTACPGQKLLDAIKDILRDGRATPPSDTTWNLSRYYTPVPGQTRYYRDTYEADFKVNCSGDCLVTADGYHLKPEDAYKVAACPPELPSGTVLKIDGLGDVVCHDRGGAIKEKRIDIWSGVGDQGLQNIRGSTRGAGPHTVTILKP